ncbi:MAG TPA: LacI family DNA-binding transcriptional regulator, partial [Clostridium sp.]
KPDRYATALRTKTTNLIGVIVPKISTETAGRVVEGISNEVSKYGYDILIANTNLSVDKEIEYLDIFKNNQVDGIIFIATKLTEKHLRIMASIEPPIVVVAQETENYPCVYHDDYNASKDMVKLLLKKGYREIAFIGVTEEDISVGLERKRGYMDALKEYGVSYKEEFLKKGDFSMASGYKLATELMNQNEKPKAIFAVSDNIAVGAMQCLTDIGYKVPEDISICSIGDSKISRVVTPKLTTAHYFYKTSGEKSGQIMMGLLNKNLCSLKKIKLGYRLEIRSSIK